MIKGELDKDIFFVSLFFVMEESISREPLEFFSIIPGPFLVFNNR
jgi:hypothetical protein